MTPYVSRCRQIWVIAYPWVLSLQDLVMRRTRSGEGTQHARSPLGAAPGITSPEVSGAVLFTDLFSAVTFVIDPRLRALARCVCRSPPAIGCRLPLPNIMSLDHEDRSHM